MSDFVDYMMELLEPSGDITSSRMFGGHAIRKKGLAIAIIFQDEAYFKVDDSNRGDYQALGGKPFLYDKKGKTVTVSNWSMPPEILEDPDRLMEWVEKSYRVAVKAKRR